MPESPSSEWLPLTPRRPSLHETFENITNWEAGAGLSGEVYLLQASYGSLGAGNAPNFDHPQQLDRDSAGNILVMDGDNNRIVKISDTGVWISNVVSDAALGFGGMVLDGSDNIYAGIQIAAAHHIRKYDPAGATLWTSPALSQPGYLATDDTHLYYAAFTAHQWGKLLCSDGSAVATFGASGSGPGQFNAPVGMAVGGGFVYIGDVLNNRVQKWTTAGVHSLTWTVGASPTGLAVDADGNIVVSVASATDKMKIYTPAGVLVDEFARVEPSGVVAAPDGVLWIASTVEHNVAKWQREPRVRRSWDGAVGGAQNGSLTVEINESAAIAGDTAQTLTTAFISLNERESVEVAAWVTTDADLVPRLQIVFADASDAIIATETEELWAPVAGEEYTRAFAARSPSNATQYKVGLLVYVDATDAAGSVWFDDVLVNGNVLIVQDAAGDPGGLNVIVQIPGRWI